MSIQIPGLPEGVVCTRIGMASPEEFELVTRPNGCGLCIEKGGRQDSVSQVIVVPAEGFEFIYSIRTLSFKAVKKLAAPLEITRTVKFTVTNEIDKGIVEDRLEALKELPGWKEMIGGRA